ncbi:N-acetylmuramoyl-L-alanine amidase [Nocardiopsis sp. NPDC049922]|uniref:peptidoglycan recognition protein family protein n=1 Tax=Nocardiopsis sp. NPDC049922 TaxID=3155157 RepID=UPI0033C4196E
MKLLERSYFGWGTSGASYANPKRGIAVHYNGGATGLSEDASHSKCVSYWKNTRRYHVYGNGWADIGYSFGVCPHGYVFEGRGLNKTQAAQPGGNTTYYSVTFMIGGSEKPGEKHLRAWRDVRDYLFSKGVRKVIKCHSDFIFTSCPGDYLRKLVRSGALLNGSGDSKPGTPNAETEKAPAFPLAAGHFFGPRTGPYYSVSGYYSHREDLRRWQSRMRDRGWTIGVDGLYGPQTRSVAVAFQREKSLTVDGFIGAETWRAAWEAPVT